MFIGELVSLKASPKIVTDEVEIAPVVEEGVTLVDEPVLAPAPIPVDDLVDKDAELDLILGESSVGAGQILTVNKLPAIFHHQGDFVGPVIDCQPVKPVNCNISFPVNIETLPIIRKKILTKSVVSKPLKIVKKLPKVVSKPQGVSSMIAPQSKLAPKSSDPKMWSSAPESKKCRVGIAKLANECFFQKAGSGGFSQAEREAYDIKKKHKQISVFLSKPNYSECNCVKFL